MRACRTCRYYQDGIGYCTEHEKHMVGGEEWYCDNCCDEWRKNQDMEERELMLFMRFSQQDGHRVEWFKKNNKFFKDAVNHLFDHNRCCDGDIIKMVGTIYISATLAITEHERVYARFKESMRLDKR